MRGRVNMMLRLRHGFTLIELLIVITIVGILSVVILVSVNTGRTKALHAKKKVELQEIMTSVTRYYIDTGQIPSNPVSGNWSQAHIALGQLVADGYMKKVPISPDSSVYYYYDYGTYYLVASVMGDTYGPGSRGWHCSDAAGGVPGSKYWCLETNK